MFRRYAGCLLLGIILAGGCRETTKPLDFHQPLPAGMVALRKISPEQYPDFGQQPIDVDRLRISIHNSEKYLAAPSSRGFYPYLDITHDRAVATLERLAKLCDEVAARGAWDGTWFDQRIAQEFDVYKSYGAPLPDGSGFSDRVLFTGYCTPIYDASLERGGEYQWPLYKLPADLDRDPMTGEVHGRRTADGQLTPYYTRGQIETEGKLAGDELVWLKSRWEAYVVSVQGSARLRLTQTGQIQEIGFAGTNGYPYTSPGKQMVADGVIRQDQLSLHGLADYFAAHPEMMDHYLSLNERDVFFAVRPGGPFGSLNVPVTPLATIATDKNQQDIYPRAMPAFIAVSIPEAGGSQMRSFSGILLDQDTGGAIRASGRCDIYMGIGPEAQAMAGQELQEGSLYYLAAKLPLGQ